MGSPLEGLWAKLAGTTKRRHLRSVPGLEGGPPPDAALIAAYSEAAADYGRLASGELRRLSEPLLGTLPLSGAERILDAGAGPGGLIGVLRAAAPRSTIIAVDRAEGMARHATTTGAPAAVMDVRRLGLATDAIDVAVLAFMLFHTEDPAAALREVARTVRSGGVIGTVTWGKDRALPGADVWDEELIDAGSPANPGPHSHDLLDAPERVAAVFAEAGLHLDRSWDVRWERSWSLDALLEASEALDFRRRLAALPTAGSRRRVIARVGNRLRALPQAALLQRPEVIYAIGRVP